MKLESLIFKYRWPVSTFFLGVIIFSLGVFLSWPSSDSNLVVLDDEQKQTAELVIEVSGAVSDPGVYRLTSGSRVEDAIQKAGGFRNENTDWVAKFLNRAAHLVDGQKIYIPNINEQSSSVSDNNLEGSNSVLGSSSDRININTASQTELESLWGIGPVYAQKIIDHRPYSDISELVESQIIKQNVYDRNKDMMSVY